MNRATDLRLLRLVCGPRRIYPFRKQIRTFLVLANFPISLAALAHPGTIAETLAYVFFAEGIALFNLIMFWHFMRTHVGGRVLLLVLCSLWADVRVQFEGNLDEHLDRLAAIAPNSWTARLTERWRYRYACCWLVLSAGLDFAARLVHANIFLAIRHGRR